MSYKKIIPYIDISNQSEERIKDLAVYYDNTGADEILLCDDSKDNLSKEKLLKITKEIGKEVDTPIIIGLYPKRFEDVKKAFYTGAKKVLIKEPFNMDTNVILEAAHRFGKDRMLIEISEDVLGSDKFQELKEIESCFFIKPVAFTESTKQFIQNLLVPVFIYNSLLEKDLHELLTIENVAGIVTDYFKVNRKKSEIGTNSEDIMSTKIDLKNQGVLINTFETSINFSEFKLNEEGLIPVITKDYRTGEVLMLAYMNKEAYNTTIRTGQMTYYSRSRKAIWRKGETSGHIQYLKSLYIDCDKDTILANVKQIGPACHTGNQSCFYTKLMKKEYNETNPMTIFQSVYDTIMERKLNPKEGSYTNYLLDQGIDKILKKCGEEATEIVIAAKNPDKEELVYEISDFLYHMMVLMVHWDLDWNDIIGELAKR